MQRSSLAIGIARVRPLSDQHKYNYKRRTPTSALMQNKQYYIIYTHPNPRVYRRLGAPHYWWLGTTTLPYDVDDDDFWWPIKKIYNLSDARAPSPLPPLAPSAASRLCYPLRCHGCEGGNKEKMNPVHRHKIRLRSVHDPSSSVRQRNQVELDLPSSILLLSVLRVGAS